LACWPTTRTWFTIFLNSFTLTFMLSFPILILSSQPSTSTSNIYSTASFFPSSPNMLSTLIFLLTCVHIYNIASFSLLQIWHSVLLLLPIFVFSSSFPHLHLTIVFWLPLRPFLLRFLLPLCPYILYYI